MINSKQIPSDVLSLKSSSTEEYDPDKNSDNEQELEETENPLDALRFGSNESVLTCKVPCQIEEESMTVAPGEGKSPASVLTDENCEELAHTYHFPTEKFGYRLKRRIALSVTKHFNYLLLNYRQKFASDADYIVLHGL